MHVHTCIHAYLQQPIYTVQKRENRDRRSHVDLLKIYLCVCIYIHIFVCVCVVKRQKNIHTHKLFEPLGSFICVSE